jgi:predicted AlkP superfamily pyrophosphatase or phosphodiesterase
MLRPAFLLALAAAGCAPSPAARSDTAGGADAAGADVPLDSGVPALVVFITIDQFRADYLDRYGDQLTGGLRRLERGGALFVNATHDHANTETAPGHASVMSGRFPASTGILTNESGVEDDYAPLLESDQPGASPYRFRGSTLFDWMRLADPGARALSVSRKDRGAILPVGRSPEEVYWYGYNGKFVTSRYYHDALPGWVRRFNARRSFHALVGRAWTPLLEPGAYPEADNVPQENQGRGVTFPHRVPRSESAALPALTQFPWMDSLTLAFALDGVSALRLGAAGHTDLLAVSLSTSDAVGHAFGPDSREVHDQHLRLDRWLGAFLDSLYRLRDSSRVVIALTSDHGVAPIPELHTLRTGEPAGVVQMDTIVWRLQARMAARGVPATALRLEDWMLFVDRRAFAGAPALADSLVADFAAAARRLPGVARVETPAEIARRDTVSDAVARRWLYLFAPDAPIALAVTLAPHRVRGKRGNGQHGSPYDYDARVPVLFYGPPFTTGRFASPARVVDMAPTLARALGVRPAERLDGRPLDEALREERP